MNILWAFQLAVPPWVPCDCNCVHLPVCSFLNFQCSFRICNAWWAMTKFNLVKFGSIWHRFCTSQKFLVLICNQCVSPLQSQQLKSIQINATNNSANDCTPSNVSVENFNGFSVLIGWQGLTFWCPQLIVWSAFLGHLHETVHHQKALTVQNFFKVFVHVCIRSFPI